jgi:hypothetical protein
MSGKLAIIADWFCSLLLAAAFGYAGVTKALDPAAFQTSIDNYNLVPYGVAAAAALYLPWLEIAIALCLLTPRPAAARRAAALATLGLMLVFTAAYVSTLARGLDIDCGCFGKAGQGWPAWAILLRDAVLLAAAAYLTWRTRPPKVAA